MDLGSLFLLFKFGRYLFQFIYFGKGSVSSVFPPIELPPTFVGALPHSGDSTTSVNLRPRPSSEGYVDDDEEAEYVGLMMTVASEHRSDEKGVFPSCDRRGKRR
jgi:hypothetical protein